MQCFRQAFLGNVLFDTLATNTEHRLNSNI